MCDDILHLQASYGCTGGKGQCSFVLVLFFSIRPELQRIWVVKITKVLKEELISGTLLVSVGLFIE